MNLFNNLRIHYNYHLLSFLIFFESLLFFFCMFCNSLIKCRSHRFFITFIFCESLLFLSFVHLFCNSVATAASRRITAKPTNLTNGKNMLISRDNAEYLHFITRRVSRLRLRYLKRLEIFKDSFRHLPICK